MALFWKFIKVLWYLLNQHHACIKPWRKIMKLSWWSSVNNDDAEVQPASWLKKPHKLEKLILGLLTTSLKEYLPPSHPPHLTLNLFQIFLLVHKKLQSLISVCVVFQTDKGFDRRTFTKQMGVMRGQVTKHLLYSLYWRQSFYTFIQNTFGKKMSGPFNFPYIFFN